MKITNWQIEQQEQTVEVSAEVDGFRLWYRVPGSYAVSRTGDPFVAASLLPAMSRGEPLELDPSLTVSPRLLAHIATLQDIHHCWNPALQKVPILARTAPSAPVNAGTFSYFSGGVDSAHTLLTHVHEITHLVFIHGFDFFLDPAVYQTAVARNTSFVRGFGKTLIPVEINHYPFGYRYNLSRNLTQGSALASVALLLGFPRVYLPSSYSYDELVPVGTHPLLDPLWSNEAVDIIHDGAEARRIDKIQALVPHAAVLANLRVCFDDMNVNCGACPKCLRTMIPLRLLHVQGPFPPLPSLRVIRRMPLTAVEKRFLAQSIVLAEQSGDHALRKALAACMRHVEWRLLLKELDRVFLGGSLRRTYRRRRIARLGPPRIKAVPD